LAILEKEETRESASAHSLTTLPLATCLAAGGEVADALHVAAAWRSLHLAAKFLDDVEDGDEITLDDQVIDPPTAINLGTGFIATANIALLQWRGDSSGKEDMRALFALEFNRTILQMAAGQHTDITHSKLLDLEAYRKVMTAKSGNFFLLGSWAGARCATSDEETLSQYESFGYNLGMMLQLNDDLKDFRQTGKGGDIASRHYTFPIFYALSVASPLEQRRLRSLLAQASADIDAEIEAKSLIRVLGGEVYLLAETMRYRRRAMAALDSVGASTERREALTRYLKWLSLQPATAG
jgi:geranylgeranyl pyrophosphate synthase